jgi:hypothetical protein
MNDDSAVWCKDKHVGLREIIRTLPKTERDDQGQRHRCACCAYEAGIQEGLRRARAEIARNKTGQ